jgi:peptide/nickel transport system ATP-binding protein
MNLLDAKNITKRFGEQTAVNNVSLQVKPGEIVALVGESGCGKTTMANIVAGLLNPNEGQLQIAGNQININEPRAKALKKQVQMIFQNALGSFNPRQTIFSSVSQPLIEHSIASTKSDLNERIDNLFLSVELEPSLKNRFPHQLSGGQIQRAAIARAIACEPSLLIADEPTSALDVSIRSHILHLFKKLQQEKNLSCLVITHDLPSLKFLADRVYVMKDGCVVEEGTTMQVLNSPQNAYTKRLIAAIPSLDPADKTFEKFKAFAV